MANVQRLFEQEAVVLEKLGSHPQIPTLFSYFEEEGEFYLIQEYIEGTPLSAEMPLGERWKEEEVIELIAEILNLLEFVHSQDVIHRDIKPDNLIRRKFDRKLVLIDFGAVKQIRNSLGGEVSQSIGIGTQGYIPTEAAQGKPRKCSDLYSVGIVGIQALTGMLPIQFQEDEDGEVIWQSFAQVSPGFAEFLSKMVKHYFKLRYQSTTEALTALKQINQSSHSPTEVNGGSKGYLPTEAINPNPDNNPKPPQPIRGKDLEVDLRISEIEAKDGTEKQINFTRYIYVNNIPQSETLTETVKVPPNSQDRNIVKLSEKGHQGQYGGVNGDVCVRLLVYAESLPTPNPINKTIFFGGLGTALALVVGILAATGVIPIQFLSNNTQPKDNEETNIIPTNSPSPEITSTPTTSPEATIPPEEDLNNFKFLKGKFNNFQINDGTDKLQVTLWSKSNRLYYGGRTSQGSLCIDNTPQTSFEPTDQLRHVAEWRNGKYKYEVKWQPTDKDYIRVFVYLPSGALKYPNGQLLKLESGGVVDSNMSCNDFKNKKVAIPKKPQKIQLWMYSNIDSTCENYVPTKVWVSANSPATDMVGRILKKEKEKGGRMPMLKSYRVIISNSRVATVDFRISSQSQIRFSSFSSCERANLFGSLEETLTKNSQLNIREVIFTEDGIKEFM